MQKARDNWEKVDQQLESLKHSQRSECGKYSALTLLGVGAGVGLALALPALAVVGFAVAAASGIGFGTVALKKHLVANECDERQQRARESSEQLTQMIEQVNQMADGALKTQMAADVQALAAQLAGPGGAVRFEAGAISVGGVRLHRRQL